MEQTLVLLKPDCYLRKLMGEILSRFERKGLTVRAMKLIRFTSELADQHYAEHVANPAQSAAITGFPAEKTSFMRPILWNPPNAKLLSISQKKISAKITRSTEWETTVSHSYRKQL